MSLSPAARVEDPIHHNPGIAGFFVGAFVTAIAVVGVAVLTAATAGAGLVVLAAAGAVGGGAVGEIVARLVAPGIPTGKLTSGAANVLVNGRPLVRMSDSVEPCWIPLLYPHGQTNIVEGSTTVLINCLPASRVQDETICGAYVAEGSPDVLIGGPKGRIKGTEASWTSFFLERLGIAAFATQTALYPGSGALTMLFIGGFQADYNTYKSINTGISAGIRFSTGIDVSPAIVGWAVEAALAVTAGNVASRVNALNWNALAAAERAQAYARYVARPNRGWSYQQWSQNYGQLTVARGIPTNLARFEQNLSGLIGVNTRGLGRLGAGPLDMVQIFSAYMRALIDGSRGANGAGCACATDWYAATK